MTTTTPQLTEGELNDPEFIETAARNRQALVRLGLAVVGLVLVVAFNFFNGINPLIGLVLAAAAISVLITAAASYRMGEPFWWLRVAFIFIAASTAGIWIMGLV
jgi:uncharacterized membrane protein